LLWGAARFDGYFSHMANMSATTKCACSEIIFAYAGGMKHLQAYLKTHKAGPLAEAVGISQSYLSDMKKGNRVPSLRVAFAIEDATQGAVPARSWLTQ